MRLRALRPRLTAIMVGVVALLFLSSTNAWAATGSMSFSNNFKTTWYSNNFKVKIGSATLVFDCASNYNQSYEMRLYRVSTDGSRDAFEDRASGYCDATQDKVTWPLHAAGTYYLEFLHGNNGKHIAGSGVIYYSK